MLVFVFNILLSCSESEHLKSSDEKIDSAWPEKIAPALKNTFGYISANYANYNYQTVFSELQNNRPVILSGGKKNGWWIFASSVNGHTWVCDGYYKIVNSVGSMLWFNMNWGHNGTSDGYFSTNNFNPFLNGEVKDYNFEVKMTYNIRKP